MATRRNRGMDFDAAKVRALARRLGITNIAGLERRYLGYHKDVPDGRYVTVVEKAWNGKHADWTHANRLAQCLGLPDAVPLLRTAAARGAWSDLVTNERYREPFFHFVPDGGDVVRLVKIPNAFDEADLPKVPLTSRWYLVLLGDGGEEVFILLRSKARFFQLAPLAGSGFSNRFADSRLRYPNAKELFLEFERGDGIGWRQFIAVKAQRIPVLPREAATGYDCTIEQLEVFAHYLVSDAGNRSISVYTSEFVLTEPGPPAPGEGAR